MKQLLGLLGSLLFTSVLVTPVFADTADAQAQKIQQLQQQIDKMQLDLRSLKNQVKPDATIKTSGKSSKSTDSTSNESESASAPPHVNTIAPGTAPTFANAYIGNAQSFPIDLNVPGRSFVSTGPYIGVPLVYSGSNLIINSPSVNEDVTLLNMRKAIHSRLTALGRPPEYDHAHLLLSGIIEGQAYFVDPGVGPNVTDIDLSTMELDGYLLGPSDWVSGLFAFAYDGTKGTTEGSLNSNDRTSNSRVFLSKAFITIGDFSKSPIYATIGQLYVPYGTYSTNMISNPLTKILGRTKARALVMGFQERGDDALYMAGYMFRGETYVGAVSRVNNGGLNVGYRFVSGKVSGDFGGGAIMNLADSFGMQNNFNSSPLWGGFGANNNGNEQISHRVPGLNFRGLFAIGDAWDFLAEYIGAATSFSNLDMTYNSHGAKPGAVNAEIAYTFTAFDKPTSFAVAYGKSWNALAIELPLQRFAVVLNTSWWRDTLESLEVRHDQNYAASSFATGTSTTPTVPITGTGKPDNVVTAQFDIYF